ncbi:calcium-dependent kinase [Micractinium conductrix]|uniref:Calcium-dependent kinase n=1 Tax=Micractinium conductrix TaxID=554055 RepID=A0A2P6V7E3_9CHLO|nr:calcium-dependent kinase [Micractinium conductrix]|eukprot:PSC70004.1 calcium-dependent kinase [Micractinium conductrix]
MAVASGAMTVWKDIVRPENGPQPEQDYTVGNVLGKGAFGVVRHVVEKETGQSYACKSISKAKLITKEDVDDVRREVEILNLVSPHTTVADLKQVYEDRYAVHIVMELCVGGELFERIVAKGTFSEAEAARHFRRMVEMVAHLHALGVMHRDIKPENFLLTDQTDAADLKACDFGLSDFFKPEQRFSALIGSAYYVAPEVLRRSYGPECDIWSLGVVLYILISGMPPFWGDNEKEIFTSILRGQLDFQSAPWPSISPAAKDLVRRILTFDTKARANASEILAHPWLHRHGVAPDKPIDSVVISRLRNFAGMTKLRKAAVLAAAQHLSYEEIHGLRELFRSFDRNGDGQITLDELREGLARQARLADGEVEQMLRDTDVDGNGVIDYEEFVASTVHLSLLEREEICIKAFQQLDKDGSGTLTADEVAEAMGMAGRMSADEVKETIQRYDKNGDNQIDFGEFLKILHENDPQLLRAAESLKRGMLSPEAAAAVLPATA